MLGKRLLNTIIPLVHQINSTLITDRIWDSDTWILNSIQLLCDGDIQTVSTRIKLVTSRETIILPCRKHLGVTHWVVFHMPLTVLVRSPAASSVPVSPVSYSLDIWDWILQKWHTVFYTWAPGSIGASLEFWRHPCGAGRCEIPKKKFGFQEQQLEATRYIGYRYLWMGNGPWCFLSWCLVSNGEFNL